MDRRTLTNGIATGALLAAGAGAIAWAQRADSKPNVVANGPMSLEADAASDEVERPSIPMDSMPADVLRAPALKPATEQSSPLLPKTASAYAAPAESPYFPDDVPVVAETPVAEDATPNPTESSAATLPALEPPIQTAAVTEADITPEPLALPVLPSGGGAADFADPFGQSESSVDVSSQSLPSVEASNEAADDGPIVLTGDDVLLLPPLTIAAEDIPVPTLPAAPVFEPPVSSDDPVFELTPSEGGSPLTGPRDQWNDTLIGDDGEIRGTPLPVPAINPPQFESPVVPAPEDGSTPVVEQPIVPPFPSDENMPPLVPHEMPPMPGHVPHQGLVHDASGSWNGGQVMMPGFDDQMLAPYHARLGRFSDENVFDELVGSPVPPAHPLEAWWSEVITEPLRPSKPSLPVDVTTLTLRALEYSPDVLAFQLSPEIQRKSICEEQAAFDWTAFAEVTYDDVSDPVGNSLTVGGGRDRLLDTNTIASGGVRRRNEVGGEFEISQRLGYQDSNSQFFVPTQQGTTRLTLSYTQPLLSQRGKAYQQSRTVLAMLETGATEDETADRIQSHLLRVTEAYWDLYRARAMYLQRRNLLGEADRILATLEGRSQMDTVPRQLLRARSAVLLRRSELTRSAMEIRNAESRLRLLVGDPQMTSGMPLELLPIEMPIVSMLPIRPAAAARTAMAHRPDIRQAVKRVRSTGVRVGVTENELMPRLDFVFNGYVAGLEGEGAIARSFGDQFSEGRPSFAAGFLFEVPLGNRAAKSRHHRRQLQMVQATHELEAVVESGLTEVELALREAETSYREMLNRYESMMATGQEMDYLRDRWNLLPGGSSTTQLLEDLLDAQERLADDEAAFVNAQVNYVLSTASLRRAMGTLLQVSPPHCPATPLAHDVANPPQAVAQETPIASDEATEISPTGFDVPGLEMAAPVKSTSTVFEDFFPDDASDDRVSDESDWPGGESL